MEVLTSMKNLKYNSMGLFSFIKGAKMLNEKKIISFIYKKCNRFVLHIPNLDNRLLGSGNFFYTIHSFIKQIIDIVKKKTIDIFSYFKNIFSEIIILNFTLLFEGVFIFIQRYNFKYQIINTNHRKGV